MAKEKLTAAEWELLKDAPLWVNVVMAAGDKKGMAGTDKREAAALEETLKGYRSTNPLIREILGDSSQPSEKVQKASKAEAEVALGRIASIVESKMGADDLDAVNDFLLLVGRNVAAAASENPLGLGEKVSKRETESLQELAVLLRATDAQKKARQELARKEQAQAAAAAKQQAEDKAKADQARKDAEAKAKAAQEKKEADAKAEQAKKDAAAKERLEKARAEAEARQKEAEQKDRLEKARAEVEAREKEAMAKREAAKAEEERAAAEAKATAEREAAAKEAAAKEAAAAPRFKEFIAEHTVVAGDNLSFISQKYYGHQGNFRLIYEANKDVIGDNMNLIRPGQKLRIPKL
jgi:nucleoid-associated protein YgaU